MAVDDFVADPEAEAGAGDALGGEEGLEDAWPDGWRRHAGAGVGDGEDDAGLAGGPVGGLRGCGASRRAAVRVMASMALPMRLLRTWRISPSKQRTVAAGADAAFDADAGVDDAALVDGEDAVDELSAVTWPAGWWTACGSAGSGW